MNETIGAIHFPATRSFEFHAPEGLDNDYFPTITTFLDSMNADKLQSVRLACFRAGDERDDWNGSTATLDRALERFNELTDVVIDIDRLTDADTGFYLDSVIMTRVQARLFMKKICRKLGTDKVLNIVDVNAGYDSTEDDDEE